MFGMPLVTLVHVALSLVGIGTGFVVIGGMIAGRRLDGWTAVFLATTVATSATGFLFAVDRFLPSHAIAIVSLALLAFAIAARYCQKMAGPWRWVYVITAVASQYFNAFVLVVQAFLKVPALKELAPTQTELPFAIAQLAVLVAFVVLGTLAVRRFRVEPAPPG
jgi:hypothetical protein